MGYLYRKTQDGSTVEEGFLDKLDLYTHQYRKGELDINVYTSFPVSYTHLTLPTKRIV